MLKMISDSFKNKNILVVGGAGFIGSNLILNLLNAKPKQIIIIDNLLSSNPENIIQNNKIKFICGSITNDNILSSLQDNLDYVFHLACYHGNQSSINNPIEDHQNNSLTSLKLFDRLSKFKNLKKIVYASAACAVAEKTYKKALATTEDQPISLYHDSPYSISKIIGEFYGNYYFLSSKLPIVKARFSNVYGPREVLGAGNWRGTVHSIWRNVIPSFIWKSLNNKPIPLNNNGKSTRDFIYVKDLVDGLILCAIKGKEGGVYNLATGQETEILKLANTIVKFTKSDSELQLLPARNWDRSGKRFASIDKASSELGFNAQINIEEGIKLTIQWTKKNYESIKFNVKKHETLISNK